jgi:hypothetical protein
VGVLADSSQKGAISTWRLALPGDSTIVNVGFNSDRIDKLQIASSSTVLMEAGSIVVLNAVIPFLLFLFLNLKILVSPVQVRFLAFNQDK